MNRDVTTNVLYCYFQVQFVQTYQMLFLLIVNFKDFVGTSIEMIVGAANNGGNIAIESGSSVSKAGADATMSAGSSVASTGGSLSLTAGKGGATSYGQIYLLG